MRIPSPSIPQADVLDDVIRVAAVVAQGAHTFQEIAKHIRKGERQGRYYRRAAEILGLVSNEGNHAVLTEFGATVLEAERATQDDLIRKAVLNAELFQRVLPFLELYPNGVTRTALERFIFEVTEPLGDAMINRRASSVIAWLLRIGVLGTSGHRFVLVTEAVHSLPILEFKSVSEPMFPTSGDLIEYENVQARVSEAKEDVAILMNQVAIERANNAHIQLVNLVADRIRAKGYVPRCNQLIDLSARIDGTPDIFEMKSQTDGNVRSQIRRGISQLYEYRYLQNIPDARLVLALENPLPTNFEWMLTYLEKDRRIRLIWDGGHQLYASEGTREELAYLWG